MCGSHVWKSLFHIHGHAYPTFELNYFKVLHMHCTMDGKWFLQYHVMLKHSNTILVRPITHRMLPCMESVQCLLRGKSTLGGVLSWSCDRTAHVQTVFIKGREEKRVIFPLPCNKYIQFKRKVEAEPAYYLMWVMVCVYKMHCSTCNSECVNYVHVAL